MNFKQYFGEIKGCELSGKINTVKFWVVNRRTLMIGLLLPAFLNIRKLRCNIHSLPTAIDERIFVLLLQYVRSRFRSTLFTFLKVYNNICVGWRIYNHEKLKPCCTKFKKHWLYISNRSFSMKLENKSDILVIFSHLVRLHHWKDLIKFAKYRGWSSSRRKYC